MCRGCIHQSFLSWRTIWDLSLSAILMHFTLSCRASQATKVQTPRGCQLPLGCHQLSGFSLGLENLSKHMILLLYKSTRCRRITRCIYMCIFGYCIFNPISAALHSAMACSSFPDPMNFWLKCFHILEDLQVHKNKGWRACMISGRSKWRGKCQQCSVVIYFLQPKDWSEWSNTCYDVEVDQPWSHATSPD